jgi:translation initiation factor 2A
LLRQVILHDFKCKPVFDLGSGPYNVARWNPFGRFLAIAGFGNLPGRYSLVAGCCWCCSPVL